MPPFNDVKLSPLPTMEEVKSKSKQFTNQLLKNWQQNAAAKNKAETTKGNKNIQTTNENNSNQESQIGTDAIDMDSKYNTLLQKATDDVKRDIGNSDIVNILKNYDWVANKNTKDYRLIPAAYVREFRQNVSTFAMSLKWFFSGPGQSTIKSIGSLFNSVIKDVGDSSYVNKITDFIDKFSPGKNKPEFDFNVSNVFNEIVENNDLLPYKMMYSFDKTNCLNYVFPYFDNDFISFTANFSDTPQVGNYFHRTIAENYDTLAGLGTLFQQMGSAGELLDNDASNNFTWSNHGIYLEKPKYFQYGYEQDTATIKFILYNTVNHNMTVNPEWQKNYRFIKSFVLKNLPYKLNAFKYKTPALYEVSIPGVKYFPVSFVSKMIVNGLGTRRYLSYTNNQKVLVPDAWEINIEFRSLLYKSANLYATALEKGPVIIDPNEG